MQQQTAPNNRRSERPRICLIDEDERVHQGWEKAVTPHAELHAFVDHVDLFKASAQDGALVPSFVCIVMGRHFGNLGLDITQTDIPLRIREKSPVPLFLNWQGYVAKSDLERLFDGKIYHRYGISWHTLKGRIQRINDDSLGGKDPASQRNRRNKVQKCRELLLLMARKANEPHRSKIEHYAEADPLTGVQLLEAIYNRLITQRDRPLTCPSRYINSSPIIAARILRDTLHEGLAG